MAHLAYRFARHFQAIQGAELQVERRDLRIAELAGEVWSGQCGQAVPGCWMSDIER